MNLILYTILLIMSDTLLAGGTAARQDWTTQQGVHLNQDIWKKKEFKFVMLAYTSCMSICPMLTTRLKSVNAELKKKNIPLPQVYLISIDPGEDTEQARSKFLADREIPEWIFLAGPEEQARQVAGALDMGFGDRSAAQSSHMSHTTRVALIDTDGKQLKNWDLLAISPAAMSAEIEMLLLKK